jgi:hypothetical protein
MEMTKLRENHKIYQKVDISLLFKSQNILQKRFLATVSILEKQLKAGNSKNCNSEAYFQFFSTLAYRVITLYNQKRAKKIR